MLNGKFVEKTTWVKMARDEMARYMAEYKITDVKDVRIFDRLNFGFLEERSNESTFFSYKQRESSLLCNGLVSVQSRAF